MAYSSLWSDGRADDHIAQQQLPPFLICSYCSLESAHWGLGSTIHKYQVAAFSSIFSQWFTKSMPFISSHSLLKAPALFDHIPVDPTQL